MKRTLLFGLLLCFAILTTFGCGGGGGGGGGTDDRPAVSGTVAKGPVSGATIQIFEVISSHNPAKARVGTTVIGQGTTAADGSYSVRISSAVRKGGVLVRASGGAYTDEATGAANKTLSTPLNAIFQNISGMVRRGETVTVHVTPFTELGFRGLGDLSVNRPTDNNIAAANAKVSSTLGLAGVDVVRTRPLAANAAPPQGSTAAQIRYSQALAAVSQLLADDTTLTLADLMTQLAPDVRAGVLSAANAAAGERSRLNFLDNPNNKTGPAEGLTVTVAPNKPRVIVTSVTNDKAIISATVRQGSLSVPDGTKVTFSIKSGAGASLSAASATTTNGVASVELTGTIVDSQVVVSASAGGVKADAPAVRFIDQPTEAVVTVSLTGTLPAGRLIGGTTARIAFQTGKGLGTPTAANVGIGAVADAITTNTGVNPTITPAAWTSGTQPGEVVRLTFPITPGNFPTAADFSVDPASEVVDLNNVSLEGPISVSISVSVQ